MKFSITYLSLLLFLLVTCQKKEKVNQATELSNKQGLDVHSYARSDEAVVKHIDLNIEVDFDRKIIYGTAKLSIEQKKGLALFLDTKDLIIKSVKINEKETPFKLHPKDLILGSALEIELKENTKIVSIVYETSPNASALQWLNPEQTFSGKSPFLFTQSQPILARSWIPCQDSPGIRFTYQAKVKVPENLLALMSASNPNLKSSDGLYEFSMDLPIPAYLMALAVGDLVFGEIGEQTGVYADPDLLEKSHYEFGDMQAMLEASENLYGQYHWNRYDVLVLPPSFPFGGMENPRLTFATPTILAGDRSLTALIAHELAHSWSGNLVTNATWSDFWLNEGFTTYFEIRIMEAVYGKDIADMLVKISYDGLLKVIKEMESVNPNDTKLKIDLTGRDPEEGITAIPYDKGMLFLKMLEENLGRQKWDSFLNQYFEKFSFQSITTEYFLAFLKEKCFTSEDNNWQDWQIETWVYGTGLPSNCPQVITQRFEEVEELARVFLEDKTIDTSKTNDWVYQQWIHFLNVLEDDLTKEDMALLDNAFHFTKSGNSEILFKWLHLSTNKSYEPAFNTLKSFLANVGRTKFVLPLYKAMFENPDMDNMAEELYQKNKYKYHYLTTSAIDKIGF